MTVEPPSGEQPSAGRRDGPGDPIVEVEALRVTYPARDETVRAVDGVDLSLAPGETLGLVGESGSGKTTLARALLSLVDESGRVDGAVRVRDPAAVAHLAQRFPGRTADVAAGADVQGDGDPDDGDFVVIEERASDGGVARGFVDLVSAPEPARRLLRGRVLGMVFQDPGASLNPVYSVGNQLVETLRETRGLGGRDAREAAVDLLGDVDVPDPARQLGAYPHELSGGLAQRVAIALALAGEPRVLVCDEPTSALDATVQASILDLLTELQHERDLAVLLVTHDASVVARTADRVAVLYAGEVVERAGVEALFDAPAHPYTRGLLGALPGSVPRGERLRTVPGQVPTPTEPATDCRFAPRCPHAFDACDAVHPDLAALDGDQEGDHDVACHLYDDAYEELPPAGSNADSPADWTTGGPDSTPGERSTPPTGAADAPSTAAAVSTGVDTRANAGNAPAAGEALVRIRDLRTYYDEGRFGQPPVRAVDGVDLTLHRGETLGLVGESGCGKTTLARTLLGLESPTSGSVRVGETDVTALSGRALRRWRGRAAMVFQDPGDSLDGRLTVGQIVREPLDVHDWPTLAVAVDGGVEDGSDAGSGPPGGDSPAIRGDRVRPARATERPDVRVRLDDAGEVAGVTVRESLPLSTADLHVSRANGSGAREEATVDVEVTVPPHRLRRARTADLLDRVGLPADHATRYPHQLSGGQRQRVAIARALALDPELLVLDEPVTALDASVQATLLNLLADLQADLGLTYLLIAHDLSVVRHVCDRVAVMYLGRLMEVGPTEALFADPANPYTRALLSAIPDPDPTTAADRVRLRGSPPSPRYPPGGCPFATRCPVAVRPEAFGDVPDDTWDRVERFRGVLRRRARAREQSVLPERLASLAARANAALGRRATVDAAEVRAELFAGVEVSPAVSEVLDAAVRQADAGSPTAASETLAEAFGAACDTEAPATYDVGEGRWSRCHRHGADHDPPAAAFERLSRREGSGGESG